jgi:hypothetical protein
MLSRGIRRYFVLSCLVMFVCGCGRPNFIGTDAAVYSRGTLYAVAGHNLNSVYDAALAALDQLEVEVVETAKDVFYAKVVGKIADGKSITIRMEPETDNITNIDIKAGKFLSGNEERARVVYEKIRQNL